jgi:hypothetical protein
MHDIDYAKLEVEPEYEHWEQGDYESGEMEAEAFEYEAETYGNDELETDQAFSEIEEAELAMDLLEVSSDAEIDEFIRKVARRVARGAAGAARNILASQDMRAVGGILKGAARRALPHVGSAVGRHFAGNRGAHWGRKFGGAAGRLFELELEGLSGEDQEFEIARSFVRFAGNTIRNMTQVPSNASPQLAARNAALAAARIYAPGLLKSQREMEVPPSAGRKTQVPVIPTNASSGQSGRWIRRGNRIILYGV